MPNMNLDEETKRSGIPAWLLQYTKDIASMELGLLGAAVAFYYQSVSSGLG